MTLSRINCARSALRIAQVAPLCGSVPSRLYGGTERIVAHLERIAVHPDGAGNDSIPVPTRLRGREVGIWRHA